MGEFDLERVIGCWLNMREHLGKKRPQVPRSTEYLVGVGIKGSQAISGGTVGVDEGGVNGMEMLNVATVMER